MIRVITSPVVASYKQSSPWLGHLAFAVFLFVGLKKAFYGDVKGVRNMMSVLVRLTWKNWPRGKNSRARPQDFAPPISRHDGLSERGTTLSRSNKFVAIMCKLWRFIMSNVVTYFKESVIWFTRPAAGNQLTSNVYQFKIIRLRYEIGI